MGASLLMMHAACGLLFNLRPDHVVLCAPTLRMAEPSEFQTAQAVSSHPVVGRRGVICAFSAWAFSTMAGTAAAMADETDEQQSIEAEAARRKVWFG